MEKKTKFKAVLFASFLGVFGGHRFYLGDNNTGWMILILSLVTFGFIGAIWAWIDLLRYLCMTDEEFNSEYNYDWENFTSEES